MSTTPTPAEALAAAILTLRPGSIKATPGAAAYRRGHQAARHAAAELVLAAQSFSPAPAEPGTGQALASQSGESCAGGGKVAQPWGPGDFMAVAGVRYCLGRMSAAPSICADWLRHVWRHLKPGVRTSILRELRDEIARDDEARERGDSYKPLGWDCDRATWVRLLEVLEASEGGGNG